jgi:hypothetical protein
MPTNNTDAAVQTDRKQARRLSGLSSGSRFFLDLYTVMVII